MTRNRGTQHKLAPSLLGTLIMIDKSPRRKNCLWNKRSVSCFPLGWKTLCLLKLFQHCLKIFGEFSICYFLACLETQEIRLKDIKVIGSEDTKYTIHYDCNLFFQHSLENDDTRRLSVWQRGQQEVRWNKSIHMCTNVCVCVCWCVRMCYSCISEVDLYKFWDHINYPAHADDIWYKIKV